MNLKVCRCSDCVLNKGVGGFVVGGCCMLLWRGGVGVEEAYSLCGGCCV